MVAGWRSREVSGRIQHDGPCFAVSSPSCANFALKKAALDNAQRFDPVVSETIDRSFYVDDCLKSVDTANEATELAESLRKLCSTCGFRLGKFVSNNREVLASIPESERGKAITNQSLTYDHLSMDEHWAYTGK